LKRVGVQAKHEYNGERKKKEKKIGRETKTSKGANGPSAAPAYHVTHKRDDLRYGC